MRTIEQHLQQHLSKRWVLHSAFWIFTFFISVFGEMGEKEADNSLTQISHMFLHFIGFATLSYFNLYVLIPKFFITRHYVRYSVFVVLAIILSAMVFQGVLHDTLFSEEHDHSELYNYLHICFFTLVLATITTFFHFLRRWIKLQDVELKLQEKEKEHINAKLEMLKAQINPHFLFNSLNNIYSLTLDNSQKASQVVLKLSDLLSYVLYDASANKVALTKELNFINNYMQLEKSRFESSITMSLKISGNENNIVMAPLLFIPFIENAFKHGSSMGTETPFIHVRFSITDGEIIHMTCVNSIDDNTKATAIKGGVGIENVRKRLNLIYPDQHTLEISENDHTFEVNLTICAS